VGRDAANVVEAEIQLADAFGTGQVRDFLYLYALGPAAWVLSSEIVAHYYLTI
jgi:hypothetical protein